MKNNKKTAAFFTLGCKLNFAETSTLSRLLGENNFNKVDFKEKADVYVINTCSVTEAADKKCRNIINKACRTNPNAIVAVVGCYAQLKPETISQMPGVDLVLGSNEKFDIIGYINKLEQNAERQEKREAIVSASDIEQINQFFPSFSMNDRTRSFLKVQDGCDYLCTYCTIPLARGKSRNNTIEQTINEAKKIAASPVREVVLTGVNIGDFGKSTNETFFDLIKRLDETEGIDRFRISSIEPNLLSNDIIEFTNTSKRFVPHFHIPLQSGSNKLLTLMKRRYKRELFADRVEHIKKIMPHCCIGADVIVGFPNETEDDFLDTYNFLTNLPLSYLHVFSYSERPNTEAAKMAGKVLPKEKDKRSKMLHILSEKKRRMFYEQNKGRSIAVLFEKERHSDKMFGFTNNYVKVTVPYNEQFVNKRITVTLKKLNEQGIFET